MTDFFNWWVILGLVLGARIGWVLATSACNAPPDRRDFDFGLMFLVACVVSLTTWLIWAVMT